MTIGMLFRKFKTALAILRSGRYYYFFSKIRPLRELISLISFVIPPKSNHKFIILGSHGVGINSIEYYMNEMGARSVSPFHYELVVPFSLRKECDFWLFDKVPTLLCKNLVLSRIRKRVPCYQILRDPISILRSCINITMFHRLSLTRSRDDIVCIVRELVMNFGPHMYYFSSTQELVEHAVSCVTYIDQRDLGNSRIQQTLDGISERFSLKKISVGDESVYKGSVFPRAFPYRFSIGECEFVVSVRSRLYHNSSEMDADMNVLAGSESHKRVNDDLLDSTKIQLDVKRVFRGVGDLFELYEIRLDGDYEHYPVVLYARSMGGWEDKLQPALERGKSYISFVVENLDRYNSLCIDESWLIQLLICDQQLKNKLKSDLTRELSIIERGRFDIYSTFTYTIQFLRLAGVHVSLEDASDTGGGGGVVLFLTILRFLSVCNVYL